MPSGRVGFRVITHGIRYRWPAARQTSLMRLPWCSKVSMRYRTASGTSDGANTATSVKDIPLRDWRCSVEMVKVGLQVNW